MWKRFYRSKLLWGALGLIVIGGGVSIALWSGNNQKETISIPVSNTDANYEEEVTIKTVLPQESVEGQSLTLIGTVVSNEFATVYARRNGIIKDLYVDIGDQVVENQQIGELLPPGDIGQSSANIYEKQVRVQEAQADLAYMEDLSEQKIASAKLAEELQGLEGSTTSAEMLDKIKVDIDNKYRELEQIVARQKQQLMQLEADIKQERIQARSIVEQSLETMQHVMLGDDHSSLSVALDDFRKGLGSKNTMTKRDALAAYRALEIDLGDPARVGEEKLLVDADGALQLFVDMVSASNPSGELTQSQLEEFTQMLLAKQKTILDTQEMLEDIQNTYQTTIQSQEQEIVMVESVINKLLAEYDEKSATFDSALEKARQQSDLVLAEQQLVLQQAQNRVAIAKANLTKEYASSGNERMVSPFAGTVSKRMVQVGDMVSMGMPLYELIDVPTSLSQKAKREVVFGLPEEYLGLVDLGDQIRFSIAQNNIAYYTGTIHRLSPQVDEMTKTINVQAQLADDVVLPHNSRVNIIFEDIRQPTYQLPASALIYSDGVTKVAILQDQQPVLIDIAIVSDDGEFADVQGAIDLQTQIITNYHQIK